MIKIRRNTFETNSSSTHSITMCYENDFEKFKKGELFYDRCDNKLVDKDVRIKRLKKDFISSNSEYEDHVFHFRGKTWEYGKIDEVLFDLISNEELEEYVEEGYFDDSYYIPITYDEFMNGDLETYEEEFAIDGGQKIIAFGQYGYEG